MPGPVKFNRPTRRCAAADRPLEPGEWYYSVITGDEDELVRIDYAADGWTGPPADALAHWKRQMPPPGPKKLVPVPPAVQIDLLRETAAMPERYDTRYLLALTLLRRRVIETSDPGDDPGQLHVQIPTTGETLTVEIRDISPTRAEAIAESLQQLLFTEETEEVQE